MAIPVALSSSCTRCLLEDDRQLMVLLEHPWNIHFDAQSPMFDAWSLIIGMAVILVRGGVEFRMNWTFSRTHSSHHALESFYSRNDEILLGIPVCSWLSYILSSLFFCGFCCCVFELICRHCGVRITEVQSWRSEFLCATLIMRLFCGLRYLEWTSLVNRSTIGGIYFGHSSIHQVDS